MKEFWKQHTYSKQILFYYIRRVSVYALYRAGRQERTTSCRTMENCLLFCGILLFAVHKTTKESNFVFRDEFYLFSLTLCYIFLLLVYLDFSSFILVSIHCFFLLLICCCSLFVVSLNRNSHSKSIAAQQQKNAIDN